MAKGHATRTTFNHPTFNQTTIQPSTKQPWPKATLREQPDNLTTFNLTT
ncbi:MAG: hypothetical protein F6J98_11055 [Moorea sp. SIO4G2]|nr:hypothetical protein [Moorena bouillonii]NEO60945.1 hypothetical protein [Moorena sp. SIO4G2]